jgi:hypothetical protein
VNDRLEKTAGGRQPEAEIIPAVRPVKPKLPTSPTSGLTLELTCLRIHMPRETEQRDDANWTGDQEDGQHHTPRNILLPLSLSDLYVN